MRLVKDDDAVEVPPAEPVDDLLDATDPVALGLRAQRRVGGEEDALVERDRRTWWKRDNGTMSER